MIGRINSSALVYICLFIALNFGQNDEPKSMHNIEKKNLYYYSRREIFEIILYDKLSIIR
eukprot:snap_masked-scaffold_10-processed-gene-3.19-mRNA-1 protein AED:1.00 eAED:1.00 QI:0/0/0/0/1/1/2/0/59